MNAFVLQYVKTWKERAGKQSHVLEVGSLDVNGSVRKFFKDADQYIGIDLVKGKSVDKVMSSYEIPQLFKKDSFDCVIACEVFEHDPYFWKTLKNMRWALKPGGWMIISAPSLQQNIHHFPRDYYRFLPDAFDLMFFKDFIECEGMVGFPAGIKNPTPEKDLLTIVYSGKKPLKWKETLLK